MKKKVWLVIAIFTVVLISGCVQTNEGTTEYGSVTGCLKMIYHHENQEVGIGDHLVRVKGTKLFAVTDWEEGRFLINNVPAGGQSLEIIFHGYDTKELPIVVPKNEVLTIDDFIIDYEAMGPTISSNCLLMNNDRLNLSFRRAISLATDKEHIMGLSPVDATGVLNSFIFPSALGYDSTIIHEYDLEKAQDLIANQELEEPIRIIVNEGNATRYALAEYMAEVLTGLGLESDIQVIPWAEVLDRLNQQDFEISAMGWMPEFSVSPLNSLAQLFALGSYCNIDPQLMGEIEYLYDQAVVESDQNRYLELVHEIDALARENVVLLPLYYKEN